VEAESALQRTSSKLMGLVGGARGGSGQRSRTASPATLPALVQTGGSGGGGGGLQTPTGSRVRAPSGLFVSGVVAGSAAGTGGAGAGGAGGAGVGSETDRLLPAHPPTTPPPRVAGGALPFL